VHLTGNLGDQAPGGWDIRNVPPAGWTMTSGVSPSAEFLIPDPGLEIALRY